MTNRLQNETEVRDDLMRKIHTEGVVIAYDTAIGICRDPRAPAPAKATALTALFRVGGYFEKSDTGDEKPISDMSPAELAATLNRLKRKAEALTVDAADAQGDVFD